MPKRAMTVMRRLQIRRWQLAGTRIRARKRTPHGKMIPLYHFAKSDDSAKSIIKHGFQPQDHRGAYKDVAWFFNRKGANEHIKAKETYLYGNKVVRTMVPFRQTRDRNLHKRTGAGVYTVPFENLHNRKIRRVL